MKNMKFARSIARLLVIASVIVMNPVGANAEWRRDHGGWWYTEGNSWATGWRNINGKWYYFYPRSGYMADVTSVDGYYFGVDGAWVDDSSFNITAAKALDLVKQKDSSFKSNVTENGPFVSICGYDGYKWSARVYFDNPYKTTNVAWYYIDINTGEVSSMF